MQKVFRRRRSLAILAMLLSPWTQLPQGFAAESFSPSQAPNPASLDLSSNRSTVSSSLAGTIGIGGSINSSGTVTGATAMTVSKGQLLTPAESIALVQSLGGAQRLLLGNSGSAIGGSAIVSAVQSNRIPMVPIGAAISTIVIPQGVTLSTVGYNSSLPLNVSGPSNILGAMHALQTSAGLRSVLNFGSDLNIGSHGVLTSLLPSQTLSSGLFASEHFDLNVAGNLSNSGKISTPGNLNINVGGVLTNTSVKGSNAALISAQNISIQSASGTIINSGQISATGTLSFNTTSNLLSINNSQGLLQALEAVTPTGEPLSKGIINFRNNDLSIESADVNITGGRIAAADGINVYGKKMEVNVDRIDGTISNTGSTAHLSVNSGELSLGQQILSGDPSYYNNAGDITIGDLTTVGGDLAIVASGSIKTTSNTVIKTTAANNSIFLGAGLNFSIGSGNNTPNVPANDPGDTSNTLVFDGTTNTGGNINSDGNQLSLQTSGTGTVTLVATGTIDLGTGSIATESGDVLAINGAGFSASKASIKSDSGNVTIASSTPTNLTGLQINNGTLTALPSPGTKSTGDISAPSISSKSGDINISTSGGLETTNITGNSVYLESGSKRIDVRADISSNTEVSIFSSSSGIIIGFPNFPKVTAGTQIQLSGKSEVALYSEFNSPLISIDSAGTVSGSSNGLLISTPGTTTIAVKGRGSDKVILVGGGHDLIVGSVNGVDGIDVRGEVVINALAGNSTVTIDKAIVADGSKVSISAKTIEINAPITKPDNIFLAADSIENDKGYRLASESWITFAPITEGRPVAFNGSKEGHLSLVAPFISNLDTRLVICCEKNSAQGSQNPGNITLMSPLDIAGGNNSDDGTAVGAYNLYLHTDGSLDQNGQEIYVGPNYLDIRGASDTRVASAILGKITGIVTGEGLHVSAQKLTLNDAYIGGMSYLKLGSNSPIVINGSNYIGGATIFNSIVAGSAATELFVQGGSISGGINLSTPGNDGGKVRVIGTSISGSVVTDGAPGKSAGSITINSINVNARYEDISAAGIGAMAGDVSIASSDITVDGTTGIFKIKSISGNHVSISTQNSHGNGAISILGSKVLSSKLTISSDNTFTLLSGADLSSTGDISISAPNLSLSSKITSQGTISITTSGDFSGVLSAPAVSIAAKNAFLFLASPTATTLAMALNNSSDFTVSSSTGKDIVIGTVGTLSGITANSGSIDTGGGDLIVNQSISSKLLSLTASNITIASPIAAQSGLMLYANNAITNTSGSVVSAPTVSVFPLSQSRPVALNGVEPNKLSLDSSFLSNLKTNILSCCYAAGDITLLAPLNTAAGNNETAGFVPGAYSLVLITDESFLQNGHPITVGPNGLTIKGYTGVAKSASLDAISAFENGSPFNNNYLEVVARTITLHSDISGFKTIRLKDPLGLGQILVDGDTTLKALSDITLKANDGPNAVIAAGSDGASLTVQAGGELLVEPNNLLSNGIAIDLRRAGGNGGSLNISASKITIRGAIITDGSPGNTAGNIDLSSLTSISAGDISAAGNGATAGNVTLSSRDSINVDGGTIRSISGNHVSLSTTDTGSSKYISILGSEVTSSKLTIITKGTFELLSGADLSSSGDISIASSDLILSINDQLISQGTISINTNGSINGKLSAPNILIINNANGNSNLQITTPGATTIAGSFFQGSDLRIFGSGHDIVIGKINGVEGLTSSASTFELDASSGYASVIVNSPLFSNTGANHSNKITAGAIEINAPIITDSNLHLTADTMTNSAGNSIAAPDNLFLRVITANRPVAFNGAAANHLSLESTFLSSITTPRLHCCAKAGGPLVANNPGDIVMHGAFDAGAGSNYRAGTHSGAYNLIFRTDAGFYQNGFSLNIGQNDLEIYGAEDSTAGVVSFNTITGLAGINIPTIVEMTDSLILNTGTISGVSFNAASNTPIKVNGNVVLESVGGASNSIVAGSAAPSLTINHIEVFGNIDLSYPGSDGGSLSIYGYGTVRGSIITDGAAGKKAGSVQINLLNAAHRVEGKISAAGAGATRNDVTITGTTPLTIDGTLGLGKIESITGKHVVISTTGDVTVSGSQISSTSLSIKTDGIFNLIGTTALTSSGDIALAAKTLNLNSNISAGAGNSDVYLSGPLNSSTIGVNGGTGDVIISDAGVNKITAKNVIIGSQLQTGDINVGVTKLPVHSLIIRGPASITNAVSSSVLDLKNLGAFAFTGNSLSILSAGSISNSGKAIVLNAVPGELVNIIAGFDFSKASSTYQLSGGNAGKNIDLSKVSFAGSGSLLAVSTGSLKTGTINLLGGSVALVGNGVSVGSINTSSMLSAGTISIESGVVSISGGPILIDNGVISGGSFAIPSPAGNIVIASVNAGKGDISLVTGGSGSITQSTGSTISTDGLLEVSIGTKALNLRTAASNLAFHTAVTTTAIVTVNNSSVSSQLMDSEIGGNLTITSAAGIGIGAAQTVVSGGTVTLTNTSNIAQLRLADGANLQASKDINFVSNAGTIFVGNGTINSNGTVSAKSTGGYVQIMGTNLNASKAATISGTTGVSIDIGAQISTEGNLSVSALNAYANLTIGDNVQLKAGKLNGTPPPNGVLAPTAIATKGSILLTAGAIVGIGNNNVWTANGGDIKVTAKGTAGAGLGQLGMSKNNQFIANGGNIVMLARGVVNGNDGNFFHARAYGTSLSDGKGGGIEIGSGLTASTFLANAFNLTKNTNPTAGALGPNVLYLGNIGGAITANLLGGTINLNATNLNPSLLNLNGSAVNGGGGVQVFDAKGTGSQVIFDHATFQTEAFKPISMVTSIETKFDETLSVESSESGTLFRVGSNNAEFGLIDDGENSILSTPDQIRTILKNKHVSQILTRPRTKLHHSKNTLTIISGEIFINARSTVKVKTNGLELHATRGALTSVETIQDRSYIRVCSDNGTVSVIVDGKTLQLNSGEELLVTNHKPDRSELRPQDGIGRRATRTSPCGNRYISISDFSIITMLTKASALSVANKQLTARMLKTAASIDFVLKHRGPYLGQ